MIFESNSQTVYECIKKYKRSAYFYLPLYVIIAAFMVMSSYQNPNDKFFTLFLFVALIILFFRLPFHALNVGVDFINRIIVKIEVDNNQVAFQTSEVSIFSNLIRKEPISIIAKRDLIKITQSQINYPFDKEITKQIYILIYAGDEYLLAENFFYEFQRIIAELGNVES
jgi:hypothetical protein